MVNIIKYAQIISHTSEINDIMHNKHPIFKLFQCCIMISIPFFNYRSLDAHTF